MSKPATFEAWFEAVDPNIARVATALRDVVTALGPGLSTGLAWGFPCWTGNARICSIIAHADRCNLQLWSGNRLAEVFPSRVAGTGKQMRHVKVHAVKEIDEELRAIIAKAIELDRTAPEKVR